MKARWFFVFVIAVLAYASDPWKKDFKQWSQDDVQHILKDSPWAKEALARFDAKLRKERGDLGSGISVGGGDPVNGGMPAGPGRPPVAGMSGPLDGTAAAGLPTMNVTVRWESSLPVREAMLRLKFGNQLPPEGDPAYNLNRTEDHYIVGIAGLVLPRKRPKPGEEESGQDRMRAEFLATARLIRRNHNFIGASDVKVNPPEAREEVLFFFPKTDPVMVEEKDVIFEAEQGAFIIRRVFHLKEMQYHGKLEL